MTVYVLGSGASKHAGYPLACETGGEVLAWMKAQTSSEKYPVMAEALEETCNGLEDIDGVLDRMRETVRGNENGMTEQQALRALVSRYGEVVPSAIREWYYGIARRELDSAYAAFANRIVHDDDCILTFNYDVSLDRRLRDAGKWHLGDGYGFSVEGFPFGSPVKLLKLHGSANWLALLSGLPTSSIAQLSQIYADPRPVFAANDVNFLGYPDQSDLMFQNPSLVDSAMIVGRTKEFSFDGIFGPEWGDFWRSLWDQAETALRNAKRIVICGYSMPLTDKAACRLLFDVPSKDAEFVISSGERRTPEIVNDYKGRGFTNVEAADLVYFEEWVAKSRPNASRQP